MNNDRKKIINWNHPKKKEGPKGYKRQRALKKIKQYLYNKKIINNGILNEGNFRNLKNRKYKYANITKLIIVSYRNFLGV